VELVPFAAHFFSMTAAEARARAKECEERAKTTDSTVRNFNKYLAAQWRLIADQLELEGRVGPETK